MSSYVNTFLKTEITCIPRLLHKYIGDYYNNALSNGATWLILFWCILHFIFDLFLKAFLKKARYKEYVSNRLVNSLWYLGFFGTALIYCGATIFQNDIELFNFKKMHVPSTPNLPSQLISGYMLISTFFFHSSIWEALKNGSFFSMLSYFLLGSFLVISYILRIVEISFTLTSLISIPQMFIEITRITSVLSNQNNFIIYALVSSLLLISILIFISIYLFIIPISFIVPMTIKVLTDYPNTLLKLLLIVNILWLITELYKSVLHNLVNHWLYHNSENESKCFSIIDCSLFEPRDDIAYNLQQLREDIKEKNAKLMSLRKPKNKNMLIQTLKCMVAIKRKLSEKRSSETSDSDDSEKSDDSESNLSSTESISKRNNEADDDETDIDNSTEDDCKGDVVIDPGKNWMEYKEEEKQEDDKTVLVDVKSLDEQPEDE